MENSEKLRELVILVTKMIGWFVFLNLLFLLIFKPGSLAAYIFGEALIMWVIYLLKNFIEKLHRDGFGDIGNVLEKMNAERDKRKFYGRRSEYRRLLRFLSDPEGGSVLVAGHRGSGKTRLVNEVLRFEQTGLDRAPNLVFWVLLIPVSLVSAIWKTVGKRIEGKTTYQYLPIRVPLVVLDSSGGDSASSNRPEEYRSIILRAIAFALMDRARYRVVHRWLLLTRFWSITRLRLRIRSLKKFVDYTHLSDFKNTELSFSKNPALMSVKRALSGQVDLSDAKLEMVLSSIFRDLPSAGLKLVIILDELDKLYPDSGSANAPKELMLYLKDLFSTPFVHAIIIAGYLQGQHFARAAESRADNIDLTLFKDVIMVDALDPLKFEELAEAKIAGRGGISENEEQRMLEKVVHGLGIYTGYIPGVLNNFLKRCDPYIEDVDILLSKELGTRYSDEMTLLRGYVNRIQGCIVDGRYRIHHDDGRFNAVLHRIICQASESLVLDYGIHFSLEHPETMFYAEEDPVILNSFLQEYKEINHLEHKKPEAAQLFDSYIGVPRDALKQAMIWLVVFLERSGLIELDLSDAEKRIVRVKSVDMAAAHNGLDPLRIITKYSQEEGGQINHIRNLHLISSKFLGDTELIRSELEEHNLPVSLTEKKVEVGTMDANALFVDWRNIGSVIKGSENKLTGFMVDALGLANYATRTSVGSANIDIGIEVADKKLRVSFALSDDWQNVTQGFNKVVIIKLPGVNLEGLSGAGYKQFDLSDGPGVVKSYLGNLATKLESQ